MGPGRAPKAAKKQVPRNALPQKSSRVIPFGLLSISRSETDEHHLSWRLTLIDRDFNGSWSWRNADFGKLVAFLVDMEKLSWSQVLALKTGGKGRRGALNKFIPVEHLCKEARDRLNELGYDFIDELFRFRHGNMGRLWGYVADDGDHKVFYPIWWDGNHQVCPSNDK